MPLAFIAGLRFTGEGGGGNRTGLGQLKVSAPPTPPWFGLSPTPSLLPQLSEGNRIPFPPLDFTLRSVGFGIQLSYFRMCLRQINCPPLSLLVPTGKRGVGLEQGL